MTRKYTWLIIFALALVVGGFLFFQRLYQRDMALLTDFVASYQRYDKAAEKFSLSKTDSTASEARDALDNLAVKAAAVSDISSLIKNDGKARSTARQIADLASQEFDALRSSKDSSTFTNQRKAAYADFLALGGQD